ncbi:MAG: UDP-N-acetylmuramoyl-L-alanine--D-glutamate ligase [Spirochaetia bacterium]|nr:UDP-N-acetylmuramoyl-L-alanine--D-glutamate ligase [Spirochaetia bacterium]
MENFNGKKITIMGLGLNGGGMAAAKFFASRGATVTVTDLRDAATLKPSMDMLSDLNIRYVLEKHDFADFEDADIVIKNPAVPLSSPYLAKAKRIETDISIFLSQFTGDVIAVTGSKGKSTTVSAIYHGIKKLKDDTFLGGNITISPLTFIDQLTPSSLVILELSSWQLADIRGKNLLKPAVSVITNIMHEHQNRYSSVQEYADDKKVIYQSQNKDQYTLCNFDDSYGQQFFSETPGHPIWFSSHDIPYDEKIWIENKKGYICLNNKKYQILPEDIMIPGEHNRKNLLIAAAVMYLYGFKPQEIQNTLQDFRGIPHRLEFVREINGRKFYNDTTATVPQACLAAVKSFESPVVLIAGGTDKNLEFDLVPEIARKVKKLILLDGSATKKFMKLLDDENLPFFGPFDSLEKGLQKAVSESSAGDVILFSPGSTSFEMFKNEFDRGNSFIKLVSQLC